MYIPDRFRVDDPKTIAAFIREHPFGCIVTWDGKRPTATHIPFLLEETDAGPCLLGHLSRANPQRMGFQGMGFHGGEALVIFEGPHTYVSAGWYSGPGVPTWNYMIVHAYGSPELVDDAVELRRILDALVRGQEALYRTGTGYDLSRLPDGFVDKMAQGIVGVRIPVSRFEASFKLSQNADATDYQTVILKLRERGDTHSVAIADAMAARRG